MTKLCIVEVNPDNIIIVYCEKIEQDPLLEGNLFLSGVKNITKEIADGKILVSKLSIKKEKIDSYYFGEILDLDKIPLDVVEKKDSDLKADNSEEKSNKNTNSKKKKKTTKEFARERAKKRKEKEKQKKEKSNDFSLPDDHEEAPEFDDWTFNE